MKGRWLPTFFHTDQLIQVSRPYNGCRLIPGMSPSDFDCMQFVVLNGINGDNNERYIMEDLILGKVVYDCTMVYDSAKTVPRYYETVHRGWCWN
jgi:hypothetical protein